VILRITLLVLTLVSAASCPAYDLSRNKWPTGQATIRVGIPGIASSGISWSQGFKDAMAQWSNQTSFNFNVVDTYHDPCIARGPGQFGDKITSTDFGLTVCGTAFGANVLAITLSSGNCFPSGPSPSCSVGFAIDDADIVFNNNIQWSIYNTPATSNVVDFRRVALHELGHALGLNHEQINPAIMRGLVSSTITLQADDINGANAIYSTPAGGLSDAAGNNSFNSVHGLKVFLPGNSMITGTTANLLLKGTLSTSDPQLNGRLIDIYQYTFMQDSTVDLQLNAADIDTLVYLARVDATQQPIDAFVFTDDNGSSSENTNSRLIKSLQAGTYWVGASSAAPADTGSYSITLVANSSGGEPSFTSFNSIYGVQVQVNPNPFFNGSLSVQDAALGTGNFIDLYQISIKSVVNLRVDLSSTAFDTYLYLARVLPNQEFDSLAFFEDNNSGGGTNSRISKTLIPGTYWIAATSTMAAATGSYQIAITVNP
jgi:hypothetical protein